MKKCAYCDEEKKLTKEHIWPKCIVNRMPELKAKYLHSHRKFIPSELVISDVCADCNNINLSKLDSYFCQLYDRYFKTYIDSKTGFIFEYDYELLLRSFLKITYNSSRTVKKDENDFAKYREFIKNGGETFENIVIKLDIVLPSNLNGIKVYPKSARCGSFDVGKSYDNFIQRAVSVNSFYFYILISRDNFINDNSLSEFKEIYNRIPGTIVHPYRSKIEISEFSNSNTYDSHIDFITKTKEEFQKYSEKKNNS